MPLIAMINSMGLSILINPFVQSTKCVAGSLLTNSTVFLHAGHSISPYL